MSEPGGDGVRDPKSPEVRAETTLRGLAAWGLVDLADPETVMTEVALRRYYASADQPANPAETAGAFKVLEQAGVDAAEALRILGLALKRHIERGEGRS